MIAAGVILPAMETKTMMVFAQSALLFIQVTFQGMIIAESGRRICSTRSQQIAKPGRQLITFLLFANITLWILDTFMTHNWVTQEIQLNFYGLLAWGVISRISLPLMIFYRFHSCVVLVEIWKNTYRTKEALWGRLGPTVSQVSSKFQKVHFLWLLEMTIRLFFMFQKDHCVRKSIWKVSFCNIASEASNINFLKPNSPKSESKAHST